MRRPLLAAASLSTLLGCGGAASTAAEPATGASGARAASRPASEDGLPACAGVGDELAGYLVLRSGDVVLSTSAGEVHALRRDSVEGELRRRVELGDGAIPWLVLGAPGVAAGEVRGVAEQAAAAGMSDVRACAASDDVSVADDGSVRERYDGPPLGLEPGEGGGDASEGGRSGYGSGAGGFRGR